MLATWLLWSCGSPPEATEASDDEPIATQLQSTIEIEIAPSTGRGDGRFEAETTARVLRTLEGTLLAVPRVVPKVTGAMPSPGIAASPQSSTGAWSLSFAATQSGKAVEIRMLTCAPNGGCDEDVVYGTSSPEELGGEAAAMLIDRLGVTVAESVAECLATPPSRDDYASLIAGRSAAVVYGIVEPAEIGDRTDDPTERAIYLDPRSGLANWTAARARYARGALDSAETAILKATASCPGHLGMAADAARIALDLGKNDDAIALLDGARGALDDPRLVPLWLDGWVRVDRVREAEVLGKRANLTFPDDPNVARVLADLARAQGKMDEYETWVEAWSDRASDDPEPARRLIGIMAREGRWKEAWKSIAELDRRGADDEARQWRITAGLALERYREAAQAAEEGQDFVTAARIRARAALEGLAGYSVDLEDDPSPEASLARGTQSMWFGQHDRALAQAESALRRRPHWPEALELKTEAMQALGRSREATLARNQWLAAEPPLEQ